MPCKHFTGISSPCIFPGLCVSGHVVMECIDVESLGRRSYMDLASFVPLLMLRLLGARIVLLGGLTSLNVNRAKGLDDVNRLLGRGGVCKPSSSIVT